MTEKIEGSFHVKDSYNDEKFMSDEKWKAIVDNDSTYNDQFFYAVKTTGIFCKPSCKSRVPKKENVCIFQSADQAISAKFRPCKRCKPTNERLPDNEWVKLITQYIDSNYAEKLTLETLAEVCHGSPYHLHRTFKRITGIRPVEYIQNIRINKAEKLLIHSNRAVAEIAMSVGIPNTPYFITLFKKKTGRTPRAYRQLSFEKRKMEGSKDGIKD